MSQPKYDTVIVRFGGEIGIKAKWTRKLYERRLMTNIKAVLKKNSIHYRAFVKRFGRLYIETSQAEETSEKLRKVFGISSLSPSLETTSSLDDIVSISMELVASKFKTGKSFGVRCHRIGQHQYTSQDVCRQVGQSLLNQLPNLKLRVDLNNPEQALHIEVRDDKAYLFTSITRGASGLPLGTQPKLVNLLKGDTPSAVACWMTMKRGCPPILVHFENSRPAKESDVERLIYTAERLMEWSTGFPRKLYVIKQNQRFQKMINKKSPELNIVLRKRLMLHIAQRLARMKNAEGIVTGDTIEEQSQDALHSFRITDEAVKGYPVYRPLIGFDRPKVQELAHAIGLEKTTFHKVKDRTKRKQWRKGLMKLEDIKKIEEELDTAEMVEDALKSLKVLKI